jgi:c-di-GMP-binding flagellar brake protein YcgR
MIEQRKYERIRTPGRVRLMVDAADGLRTVSGQLVDLSEGGCAILTQTRIDAHVAGRVQVEVGGVQIWLPVVTRSACCEGRGWRIGCAFDRPTDAKQRAVRALVWQRQKLVRS